jgi:O-antigen/teichoic acid export membrane protein
MNLLPQTVSQAKVNGNARAWHVARSYALMAMLPILTYSAVVLVAPELVLWVFYGGASGYLDLTLAIRLLILAALLQYAADAVVCFLHGVGAVRHAFFIAATGVLGAAVLAVPLIGAFGLVGACVTLISANMVRLTAARSVLGRLLGGARASPAPTTA